MEKVLQIQRLLLRSRRLPWVVIGLTLAILGGTILLATLQLRAKVRKQIASRDGLVLQAVAAMQQYEEELDPAVVGGLDDPANQLLVVLKTSRLKGVLAARLFDADGRFVEAFPPNVREAALPAEDLPALRNLSPASHFIASARLAEVFLPERGESGVGSQTAMPLLVINVPLEAGATRRLAGIAQFVTDGLGIAAEFARLDRHLFFQALAAFLTGGSILTLAIVWSFRRLRHTQRLLEQRTRNLLQANQELSMAAKTSAVGAVTAHLIHGLKNPLAGLQSFMANATSADAARLQTDWQQAIASTRRMQNLINQIVGVLRDEEGTGRYEITLGELVEIITARVTPLAREAGVRFQARVAAEGALPNRVANLVGLILFNLLQNALQATPNGRAVHLSLSRSLEAIVFEVRDEGPGCPEAVVARLFSPCHSAKEGGSGIGLALSRQLAHHLGAELELKRNSSAGCVFALSLPITLCAGAGDGTLSFPG